MNKLSTFCLSLASIALVSCGSVTDKSNSHDSENLSVLEWNVWHGGHYGLYLFELLI